MPWLAKLRGEALTQLGRHDEAEQALDEARGALEQQAALRSSGRSIAVVACTAGGGARRPRRGAMPRPAPAVETLAATVDDAAPRETFRATALVGMPRVAAERRAGRPDTRAG